MAKNKPFSKAPIGEGGRFATCVRRMRTKGVGDPEAVCAAIGRKKFGNKRFAKLAAKGKKS